MAYISIDNIVRSYIASLGKTTLHKYLRYMKWAMEGLKDWHLQGETEDIVQRIKIDQKKSAPFPPDMISWSQLGFKVGDRVVSATPDNTILLHHEKEKGKAIANDQYRPSQQWPDIDYPTVSGFGIYDSAVSGRGFGQMHNGVGYFKANYQCNEFQFSSEVSDTHVYLKYKTSGFRPTSETKVNEVADKLLQDYMHWQESRFKLGDASAETFARKKEYGETYKRVRRQIEILSFEGILDTIRRATDINR